MRKSLLLSAALALCLALSASAQAVDPSSDLSLQGEEGVEDLMDRELRSKKHKKKHKKDNDKKDRHNKDKKDKKEKRAHKVSSIQTQMCSTVGADPLMAGGNSVALTTCHCHSVGPIAHLWYCVSRRGPRSPRWTSPCPR
jgi:ABC-type Zn2+ transport system substrate-binding protein/surface adhesin